MAYLIGALYLPRSQWIAAQDIIVSEHNCTNHHHQNHEQGPTRCRHDQSAEESVHFEYITDILYNFVHI